MHKDTPKIIPNAIKSLTDKKFSKSTPLLSSLHHFSYETGAIKKRRADNFLNIQKVLLTILPQVELSTLSVGNFYMRHDGKVDFYNQGIDWIVEKSGVTKKTVSRVLSTLVECGYIKVKHCAGINTQGEKIRYNSIRTFTNKFFIELGMQNQTIEKTKHQKQKKLIKKFSGFKMSQKCKEGIGKVSKAFKNAVKKDSNKKKVYTAKVRSSKRSHHDEKNLIQRAYDMAIRDSISPSQAHIQC
jgi:hypothetical protein